MSRFARSADWLRQLFIPSRTGWEPPGRVAEEVSLVQPYDGGGFPIWPAGQYVLELTTAAAASGDFLVRTVALNQIMRLLSVSVRINAGVIPICSYRVTLSAGGGTVEITPKFTPPLSVEYYGLELYSPIVPQGHDLRLRWRNGDAATIVRCSILYCIAPVGSVFYV